MSQRIIRITEEMIAAQDLRSRWTGVVNTEFADGIDAACNRSNPEFLTSDAVFSDFPMPFWLVKATEDELGKVTYHCRTCVPEFEKGELYTPKYTVKLVNNNPKYNFKRIVFLMSEVSAFERAHPEVRHKTISIRKNEDNSG